MEFQSIDIGLKASNAIPAMLAYWDKDEVCRFANKAYLDWFGRTQKEMVDRISLKELLGPLYEKNLPYIKQALKGVSQSFDREITTPSGEVRFSHATYTPDFENGEVCGFTAHVADITNHKHLEVLLAKSEKQFRDILEWTPKSILLIDKAKKIQLANEQTAKLFGYSKAEMIGKDFRFLLKRNESNRNQIDFDSYFTSGDESVPVQGLKFYGERKHGAGLSLEVSLNITHSGEEKLLIAVIRDVTEEIEIEKLQKEINKRHAIFIEQAPHSMAMFDKDMCYIAASHRWVEDYNLTGQDILGRSHYAIFPEIGENWKKIHQECLRGAINQCDEAPFDREDGSRQWLTWDVRPWYVSEEEIGGLIMYTADITHIKERDHEKRKIEEILDKSNDVARIGSWEVDLIKQTVFWSRIIRELHEVEADFVPDISTGINFFKEGESRDKITRLFSQAIENGTPYDAELELVTANGKIKWVRAIGQAEFEHGVCTRVYGVFHDIDDIKNSEIKLSRANEELKAIFNSSTISIIGTDKEGIITHFNRGAEEMLQYSADEMIGKNTPQIIHLSEEVKKRGEELSAQLGKKVSVFDVFVEKSRHQPSDSREWTYVRKDGEKINVILTVSALKDIHGEITGFLGTATDITNRVESQRKLQEAKNSLEVLTERLTAQNLQLANFAHITSHNLRSPVSNLNSLLQLYKTEEDEEEKREVFGMFESVVGHLSSTLNTLVETLKVRDGGRKKFESVNFSDVLEKTKEIIVAQIMESGAQITADFSKANKINYNRSYLESIFLNLLTNSIKYKSPDQKPIIKIETKRIKGGVVFTITDYGLGIDLERHGEKLFGLNNTFHSHAESKGIGLYLTKNQIVGLGGSISAESEVGKGTKFTIKF